MIRTFSSFYYGQEIFEDESNSWVDFSEGGPEISAQLAVGTYTLEEIAVAFENLLNTNGALEYDVAIDRPTGKIVISASGNFEILTNTGTHSLTSAFSMLGFSTVADYTGDDQYTGANRCGYVYYPQFMLQSYIGPDDFKEYYDSTVSQNAVGAVQVVNYGIQQKIEMDIKFITNLEMDGKVIKNNPTGLEDFRSFMDWAIRKAKFEFNYDIDDSVNFYKVILEKTPDSSNGVGYKLKELFDKNLPDIYESGIIQLRMVD